MLRQSSLEVRSDARGFTLVELMTVVTITGILAAIGVVLVRNHVRAAQTHDAVAGIQAIRVGEEAYRAENGTYLSCSSAESWYPMETPGMVVHAWHQPLHPDAARWRSLAVSRSQSRFGYLVHAGLPGQKYPKLHTVEKPTLPDPAPDLWYVIQVRGDRDGDGLYLQGLATSYNGEVYIEGEAE